MATIYAYARVSTEGRDLNPQTDELRKDGFDVLAVEKASGTSRTRPELGRLVRQMKTGDNLKVVRIDRLARSVSRATGRQTYLMTFAWRSRSLWAI